MRPGKAVSEATSLAEWTRQNGRVKALIDAICVRFSPDLLAQFIFTKRHV